MNDSLIPGGYIILSRQLIESEIWHKPPLYLKVWIYLLTRAQHGEYKGLRRGQLRTSIPDIQENCRWYIGFRKVTPTKDQVYQILEWLRNPNGINSRNPCEQGCEQDTKATMIATTKATQGMLITVLNYGVYQNPKNYEGNDDGNNEKPTRATRKQRLPDNINKNVKNDKNDNNIPTPADKIENSLFPSEEQIEPPVNKNKAIPFDEIISYLNTKAGTSYKPTSKTTQEHIRARFNNGFKLPDFFMVIDKKCTEWLGTEQEKYLRPETLFGTKFEGYLNQKGGNKNGQLQSGGRQALYDEKEREDATAWLPTKST